MDLDTFCSRALVYIFARKFLLLPRFWESNTAGTTAIECICIKYGRIGQLIL